MYEKASYFEKEINKKTEVIGHRKIVSSLFRIAGGILTLPFTGKQLFGVALGSTLINKGLKEMNKKLEERERIVVDYKYEDITKQIEQVKDKVQYTNLVLSDSLNEIKKLKDNFENTYGEYNNILPDYNYTLEKLNAFLQFNGKEILKNTGKISQKVAQELAYKEYDKFKLKQDKLYKLDFDKFINETRLLEIVGDDGGN